MSAMIHSVIVQCNIEKVIVGKADIFSITLAGTKQINYA